MKSTVLHAAGSGHGVEAVNFSESKQGLGARAARRFGIGFVAVFALIFLSAGTLRFWQGWTFLAIAFVPITLFVAYLFRHDPQTLERRLQSKEKVREQRVLVRLIGLIFLIAFILPGLDHRWGWSRTVFGGVPLWLTVLSEVLFLAGILMIQRVFLINSYAARTIQVETGQRVITTGPYRFVRHPMYAWSLLMMLTLPLALGSFIALPVFALLIPLYILRLLNEEKVLRAELEGYSAYCERTRYRLVPFVW